MRPDLSKYAMFLFAHLPLNSRPSFCFFFPLEFCSSAAIPIPPAPFVPSGENGQPTLHPMLVGGANQLDKLQPVHRSLVISLLSFLFPSLEL